jgi:hypothetical protein
LIKEGQLTCDRKHGKGKNQRGNDHSLGVAIANLASPLGIVDVLFGSISTLIVLLICRAVTKRITSLKKKSA